MLYKSKKYIEYPSEIDNPFIDFISTFIFVVLNLPFVPDYSVGYQRFPLSLSCSRSNGCPKVWGTNDSQVNEFLLPHLSFPPSHPFRKISRSLPLLFLSQILLSNFSSCLCCSSPTLRHWYSCTLRSLPCPRFLYAYSRTVVGFAARLSPAQAATLRTLPHVLFVLPNRPCYPHTTRSPTFLHLCTSFGLWSSSSASDGIVIVLDIGIFPSHPSFLDSFLSPPPPPLAADPATHISASTPPTPATKVLTSSTRATRLSWAMP